MDIITEEFKEALRQAVEEYAGEPVIIEPVLKNNGVKLSGLSIRPNIDGSRVSPTFYIESIKPEYRNSRKKAHLDTLAARIVEAISYQQSSVSKDMEADRVGQILADEDELQRRIMPRLINYDWNHELLKETPYKRFLDLAVTFYIEVSEDAAMRIRDGMVEMSVDQMYEAAMKNARLRQYSVMQIGDLVERSLRSSGVSMIPGARLAGGAGGLGEAGGLVGTGGLEAVDIYTVPMVVITNRSGVNGAYGMLDEELLESVADGFTSPTVQSGGEVKTGIDAMYVIPSSVNEILATPMSWGTGVEAETTHIREMIKAVNETLVRTEWLSESVYIYEKGRGVRVA